MIKDRGNIKWQSAMMLPEYVKLLDKARMDYEKIEKPIIDEQMMQDIEINIHEAMEYGLLCEFRHYTNGFIHSLKGYVFFIDYTKRHYRIYDEKKEQHIFPFDIIVEVKILDEHIPLEG